MRSRNRFKHTAPERMAYDQARTRVQDGDVLMYRGLSLASRVIRWATGSPYSHAGLAVWWNDRLMVLEAVGRGVMVTPLSANVKGYHGDVEWFTSAEPIGLEERGRLVEMAQMELGKEYATWKAVLLGLRRLLGGTIDRRDSFRAEQKLFCSLYVAAVYNAIGRDLKKGVSDSFTAPSDIARSPLLRRVAALKRVPPQKQGARTGVVCR
jgi:hypothetical protein